MNDADPTVARYKPEIEARREFPWIRLKLQIPGLPPFFCARMLRSAVGEEMNRQLGRLAHIDWLGKDESGETVKRTPRIMYRYKNRTPEIFFWGELAKEHFQALAHRLRSVRVDTRERGPLNLEIDEIAIEEGVGLLGKNNNHVYLYELVAPLFPKDRQWGRRPREAGIWRNHWMVDSIQGCLTSLLHFNNIYSDDVTVAPVDLREMRVEWSRPQRGLETFRQGIAGRFTSNIQIPSGLAIGGHAAEGYGELQLLDTFAVPKG